VFGNVTLYPHLAYNLTPPTDVMVTDSNLARTCARAQARSLLFAALISYWFDSLVDASGFPGLLCLGKNDKRKTLLQTMMRTLAPWALALLMPVPLSTVGESLAPVTDEWAQTPCEQFAYESLEC